MRFLSDDKYYELVKMALDLKKDPKTYKNSVGMMAILMHLEGTGEQDCCDSSIVPLPPDIN